MRLAHDAVAAGSLDRVEEVIIGIHRRARKQLVTEMELDPMSDRGVIPNHDTVIVTCRLLLDYLKDAWPRLLDDQVFLWNEGWCYWGSLLCRSCGDRPAHQCHQQQNHQSDHRRTPHLNARFDRGSTLLVSCRRVQTR